MLVLALTVPLMAAEEPANMLTNGDFSQVRDDRPDKWTVSGAPKFVDQSLQAQRDSNGGPCARLVCTRLEPKSGSSHAMLVQQGTFTLAKGKAYEFSCRMRQENLDGAVVSAAIQDTKGWVQGGLQSQFSVTGTWRRYRQIFRAANDIGLTGRLQIWFLQPGTLLVGDVKLVELPPQAVEFTDTVAPAGGKNLLPNGSFEVGAAGWSTLAQNVGWGNMPSLHGSIEAGKAPHGESFLRIPLGGSHTPVLSFDYFQAVAQRQLSPLAASVGWIKLEKGKPYTLSASLRASQDGVPACLGVRVAQADTEGWTDHRKSVQLTRAWARYSVTFRPQRPFGFVAVGPELKTEQDVEVDVDAIQLEQGAEPSAFAPFAPVELSLEPAQPAGIFEGQPASWRLRAANYTDSAVALKVQYKVSDFFDRPLNLAGQTLSIPANSTASQPVQVPAEWKGYYRLQCSAEWTGGRLTLPPQRMAIVPAHAGKDSVCGVNHAFVSPELIRLAGKAGVAWYRDWSPKWQHVEPSPGEFQWENADVQINRVLKDGASVLPLLPPFPSAEWNSEAPASQPTNGYPGGRLRQAWAPKDPNQLARFVEQAAGRYKDRVGVWEFLNEPVYTSYALPGGHPDAPDGKAYTPADYVALLKVAAAAMRKADPNCRVMGGIAGGPLRETREVIAAGCLGCVDIFNLHIYPGLRPPENFLGEMDQLLKVMDDAGGRKPIWVTEFAYYGCDNLPRKPFLPEPSSWTDQRLLESERQCAEYTVRFFAVMLSRGVEKVFLHSGASGAVNRPNMECPLFDYGGAPRKVLPALAVMAGMLGEKPRFVGERHLEKGGYLVAFETSSNAVVMAWSSDPDAGAALVPIGIEGARCVDMMGSVCSGAELTGSPIYIVAPPGSAKGVLEAIRPRTKQE